MRSRGSSRERSGLAAPVPAADSPGLHNATRDTLLLLGHPSDLGTAPGLAQPDKNSVQVLSYKEEKQLKFVQLCI